MKKKLLILITIGFCFLLTGCKQDNMDDIDIAVTNYPNEYIIKSLYGKHANINKIYPDDVDISSYKITKKQKESFSNMSLFIYTGLLKKERKLAVSLLDLNKDLKIIDTSYVLEIKNSPEELWLNPSSLLMMAQNVRLGLKEYVSSNYLLNEIDKSYNKLKIALSELDADYRLTVENTNNKTIVVNNRSLKLLENFGLSVLCLDMDTTDKEFDDIEELISNGKIKYVYKFKGSSDSNLTTELLEKYNNLSTLELEKIDNISDEERDEGKDYISIMHDNLDLLKQELYQ